MAILNYTTKVSVNQTVNEIHKILAKAGANAILNEYSPEGDICLIKFRIKTTGGEMYFVLPANIAGVTEALKRDKVYRDKEHANRVAWRILKDWIDAQMAIINAKMAELPQVFLPYAQTNDGRTLYQRFNEEGLPLLEGPK